MVSATLDVKCNTTAVNSHVLVETAGSPWVKLSIRQDHIGRSHEVFLNVEPSKIPERPVVVRSQTIQRLAVLSVAIEVKRRLNEHRVRTVAYWHGKLVASKNVPAEAIQVTSALPVREVSAWILASVVEVDIGRVGDGRVNLRVAIGDVSLLDLRRPEFA